jgi:hypothetical protein
VVLQHVPQGPGPVVVARPSLEAEHLVGDDVDPCDVGGVPQRLEDAVGEAQAEDVEHRGLGQEVVDPEDRLLRQQPVQGTVQLAGVGEVLAEGLLDDDPRVRGQAEVPERLDGRPEERVGQRQVEDRRAAGPLQGAPQVSRRGHVAPQVPEPADEPLAVGLRQVAGMGGEAPASPVAVALVVPVVLAEGDQVDVPQSLPAVEPGQRREQQPAGEVTGAPEDDQ